MADGAESSEGRLTPDEAAQRSQEGFKRAGAVDLTPPLNKPLTEADTVANAGSSLPTQAEVALEQSLEKGKDLRNANPPSAPESPVQKITRLDKGDTR